MHCKNEGIEEEYIIKARFKLAWRINQEKIQDDCELWEKKIEIAEVKKNVF
jgi:hypothetical protein